MYSMCVRVCVCVCMALTAQPTGIDTFPVYPGLLSVEVAGCKHGWRKAVSEGLVLLDWEFTQWDHVALEI